MTSRAVLAVVLALTLMVKIAPCVAFSAHPAAAHDCCDQTGCPDLLNAGVQSHADNPAEACCRIAAQRQAQIDAKLAGIAIALPSLNVTPGPFASLSKDAVPPDPIAPAPTALRLHVLFSVFLV